MSAEGTYYNGEFPEVGDVIECLPDNGSFPKLKELEQYTVEEIDGSYVFFEGDGWWPSRFCLISRGSDSGGNTMQMIDGFPRRNRIDHNTPIELKIRDAMAAVESGDAHPLMTDAGVLLQQALNKVADYVDLPKQPNAG